MAQSTKKTTRTASRTTAKRSPRRTTSGTVPKAHEVKAKAPPAAKRSSPTRSAAPVLAVSSEDRQRMVREEAYYRAERRGFVGGDPRQDWFEAEAEVTARLGARLKAGARGAARTAAPRS